MASERVRLSPNAPIVGDLVYDTEMEENDALEAEQMEGTQLSGL